MKVKDLLKAIEKIPKETEIEIETGPYKHKLAWCMFYKGILTIGYDEIEGE